MRDVNVFSMGDRSSSPIFAVADADLDLDLE